MSQIKRSLVASNSRRITSKCPIDLADLSLLVAGTPNIAQGIPERKLDPLDGNWLFITISFDPKIRVSTTGERLSPQFSSLTYVKQLELYLKYYETVYFPYMRGFSFGSWELDSSGKLHVHMLFYSYDPIPDTYVLRVLRHGVKTDSLTQAMTKGKRDYCNSIVECTDPVATLKYLIKDDKLKSGSGLPTEKYFYHNIV